MIRDIKAKYRTSLLGFLWVVFPAIASAVGLTIASNAGVVEPGETGIPQPAFVVFNMTIWLMFAQSINAPIQGVNTTKGLLAKISFPPESVVLGKLGELLFDLLPRFALIALTFILFQVSVDWSVFLAPVGLISLILLGMSVGLLLAPIGLLYMDVMRILGPTIGLWLLITPVLYSDTDPPDGMLINFLININPVTHFLVTTRQLVTTEEALTRITGFWISTAFVLILLPLSWLVFRLSLPFAVEKVSS